MTTTEPNPNRPIPTPAAENLQTEQIWASDTETLQADALRFRNLSRLHSVTTHDLRGPPNTMVVNLEMLQQLIRKGADEDLKGRQLRFLNVVIEELGRLNRLQDRLMTQLEPPSHPIPLGAVLSRQLDLLATPARHRHISLTLQLPDRPLPLTLPVRQWEPALMALFLDALDNLPDGGRLEVELQTRQDGTHLSVRSESLDFSAAPFTGAPGLELLRTLARKCRSRLDLGPGTCELLFPSS